MARRQVQIFINGKQVQNTVRSITSEKRKLNSELRKMTIGTAEYEAKARELKRVNGILEEHRMKIRNVGNAWDKITKGGITKIAGLVGGAFAVDVLVDYGKQLFGVSVEMELLQRKAETVFGDTLPQVTKAAEENAAAMGLTTTAYVAASAAIADLLNPMQFTRQEAADISTQLVDLSGALSEWTGGQMTAEEVTRTLGKAILGEREELKQLGISIQEADVKARLADKGLENLTGTMLQQAKATATLELITEKSLDAQTAFTENADTQQRKLSELTAQIQDIANRLATILIPVFDKLVQAASIAVDIIDDVIGGVQRIINPAQAATDAFNQQAATVSDLERSFVPLLDRYDQLQTKGELNEAEQKELKKILDQVTETVPSAATAFDEYGNALDINTDKAREFVRVQQLMLSEKNREAIDEQRSKLAELQEEYDALSGVVQATDGAFGNISKRAGEFFRRVEVGGKNTRFEFERLSEEEIGKLINRFGELNNRIEGTQAIIRQLSGESIVDEISAPGPNDQSPTAEERAAQAAAAEQLRKQQEEQAKRRLADRKRQLEQLGKVLADFEQEQNLARLSEDDQALERVRQRYQQQIDLAIDLESQGVQQATEARIQLEKLRDAELLRLSIEQGQRIFDEEQRIAQEQQDKQDAADREYYEKRLLARQQIEEVTNQVLLSANELQILEVTRQYDQLLELAREYGLEVADIEKARQQELDRIETEFQQGQLDRTLQNQQQRAQAYAQGFSAISGVVTAAIQATSDASKEATALQKILTLAQIGFNAASAISSATANAAGSVPFPGNLIAIGTSIAAVLSAIAQARAVFAEVPQFFSGGPVKVRGAQDGRVYNARYVGQAPTGYLPGPALVDTSIGPVLGSERGTEYFVSAPALRNPMVLNHVQAIDNIMRARQFNTGGATNPAAVGAAPAMDTAQLTAATTSLVAVLGTLTELMAAGIIARIDDDTIIDIREQMNKISAASGGVA